MKKRTPVLNQTLHSYVQTNICFYIYTVRKVGVDGGLQDSNFTLLRLRPP